MKTKLTKQKLPKAQDILKAWVKDYCTNGQKLEVLQSPSAFLLMKVPEISAETFMFHYRRANTKKK